MEETPHHARDCRWTDLPSDKTTCVCVSFLPHSTVEICQLRPLFSLDPFLLQLSQPGDVGAQGEPAEVSAHVSFLSLHCKMALIFLLLKCQLWGFNCAPYSQIVLLGKKGRNNGCSGAGLGAFLAYVATRAQMICHFYAALWCTVVWLLHMLFYFSSLSFLVKLEQLDLGSNELEDLVSQNSFSLLMSQSLQKNLYFISQPDTLGALPNLRELWLDRNQLSTLPAVRPNNLLLPTCFFFFLINHNLKVRELSCNCMCVFVGAREPAETGVSGRVWKPSGGASLGAKWPFGSHWPAAHTEPSGVCSRQHR